MPSQRPNASRPGRKLIIAVLLVATLLGLTLTFECELPKLAYIALSRAFDKTEATLRSPILAQNYEDVVRANTEQAIEIEQYLEEMGRPEKRTPEALGLNFASEAEYLRSCGHLRSLLAFSLGYPPPEAESTPEAPTMVQISKDELATYYEFSVRVFKKVHARGVFMMPRSASGKVPLVIAVYGRGGIPAPPKTVA